LCIGTLCLRIDASYNFQWNQKLIFRPHESNC
jgi:hypothetical protein